MSREEETKKAILEMKKSRFIEFVNLALKEIGISNILKIEFIDGMLPYGEVAHIEIETNIIRVSCPSLRIMSIEEIEDTAVHEVCHILIKKHTYDHKIIVEELKEKMWRPPLGLGLSVINGGREPDVVIEKVEKSVNKNRCNYHLHKCKKQVKLYQCPYCSKYFCEEHIKPIPPSMPDFDYPNKCNEWKNRGENQHPCPNYYDYLVEEEKERHRKYGETLDSMGGKRWY